MAVAFTAIHVLTAVIDTFVSIPATAAVIPFTSSYERFWLGLGAISFDIMLALVVTSLLRRHLSRGVWRAVHLLAYVSWPVAFFHSIYSSKDLQRGPLLILAVVCALAVVAAVAWRLAAAAREVPRAQRVRALMSGSAGKKAGRQSDSRKPTAVS